jgi:hypothetical protein
MFQMLSDCGPSKRLNHGMVLHLDIELPECRTEGSTAVVGV